MEAQSTKYGPDAELELLLKSGPKLLGFLQKDLPYWFWLLDLEQPENNWINPKFWEALGYDSNNTPKEPDAWQKTIHKDDLKLLLANFEAHLKDPNHPYDQKVRYKHYLGHTVWVRCLGIAMRDSQGKAKRLLGINLDITAEKRKEELLERCNDAANIGYWEVDLIKNTLFWSTVTRHIHEVDGHYQPNVADAVNFYKPGRDRLLIQSLVNEAIQHGTPFDQELQIITAKGNTRWVRTLGQAEAGNHSIIRIYGTFHDITQKKLASQQLEAQHQKLYNVLQGTNAGSWEWNLQTDQIAVDGKWLSILGYALEDLEITTARQVRQLMHPEDYRECKARVEACLNGKEEFFSSEYRMRHKNGLWVWISGRGKILSWTDDGKPLMMFGTQIDISSQTEAWQLNKLFIAQAPSAIAMLDKDLRYISASQRWLKDYNIQDQDIIGKSHYEVFPEIGDDWKAIHQDCLKGATNKEEAAPFPRLDGTTQWLSWHVSPWYKPDGTIGGIIMNTDDITELKQREIDLQNAINDLKGIFNSETQVSIIATNLEGIITHFSNGSEKMLGYRADEMIGKATPLLIHDREEIDNRAKELSKKFNTPVSGFETFVYKAKLKNEADSNEWTYIRKDGSRIPVQLVVSAIKDSEGNITKYLGIATDLTAQKQAEEARKSLAILEAKNHETEQLTYIASHDLQEPLRTIIEFGNYLLKCESEKLTNEGAKALQYMVQSSLRMRQLISAILDYSKIGKLAQKEEINCNVLLAEVIADLNAAINEKNAEITIAPLPTLRGYPIELKLLFQNLISNALKFHQLGRTPQVHITCEDHGALYTFTVADNGIGINPKHYHKLFTIFQRLNNQDEYTGVGIGLAHCKKIVELHGGRIWLESIPGEGTSFHFTIYKT